MRQQKSAEAAARWFPRTFDTYVALTPLLPSHEDFGVAGAVLNTATATPRSPDDGTSHTLLYVLLAVGAAVGVTVLVVAHRYTQSRRTREQAKLLPSDTVAQGLNP